ncbi:hypothetical protein F8M41_016235, partial [Gigaspora margarita]
MNKQMQQEKTDDSNSNSSIEVLSENYNNEPCSSSKAIMKKRSKSQNLKSRKRAALAPKNDDNTDVNTQIQ